MARCWTCDQISSLFVFSFFFRIFLLLLSFPSLSVFSFLFHLFLPISLFPSPFIFPFLFGFFLPLLYRLVSQPFCINNPQNPLHYFLSFCSSLIRNKARSENKKNFVCPLPPTGYSSSTRFALQL